MPLQVIGTVKMHVKASRYSDWHFPAFETSAVQPATHCDWSLFAPQAVENRAQTPPQTAATEFPVLPPGGGSCPEIPGSGPPPVGSEPLGGA